MVMLLLVSARQALERKEKERQGGEENKNTRGENKGLGDTERRMRSKRRGERRKEEEEAERHRHTGSTLPELFIGTHIHYTRPSRVAVTCQPHTASTGSLELLLFQPTHGSICLACVG